MDWSVLPFITDSQQVFPLATKGGEIRESLLSLGILSICAKLVDYIFRRLHLSSIGRQHGCERGRLMTSVRRRAYMKNGDVLYIAEVTVAKRLT